MSSAEAIGVASAAKASKAKRRAFLIMVCNFLLTDLVFLGAILPSSSRTYSPDMARVHSPFETKVVSLEIFLNRNNSEQISRTALYGCMNVI